MEWRIILFNVLALIASGYAVARGGAPERIAGTLLLLGVVLTRAARLLAHRFAFHVDTGVLVVDAMLLVALTVLACRADRFWPLWLVTFQLLGTSAHCVMMIDPSVLRAAYAFLTRAWSYPMMLVLVVATVRHQRRVRGGDVDRDWSRLLST